MFASGGRSEKALEHASSMLLCMYRLVMWIFARIMSNWKTVEDDGWDPGSLSSPPGDRRCGSSVDIRSTSGSSPRVAWSFLMIQRREVRLSVERLAGG